MRIGEYTKAEFLELIEQGLEDAIDRVASRSEWATFKVALDAWVRKVDSEIDKLPEDG
jgi:hypothetical protein